MSWGLISPWTLVWAAIPLGVAVLLWLRRPKTHQALWFHTRSPQLHRRSLLMRSMMRAQFVFIVLCLVGYAWIAARPYERESWTEKSTEGIDIMITLDVSESMDADDFLPSRLVVAKNVITDFIKKREHDRIGLNVFGGEAVTKSPLTRDHTFLLEQVAAISLRELKQGTAIGMGLANAILRLKDSTAKSKVIVLLTDGDSNVGAINPITASQLARQQGIRVYPIGIGQKDRVIIPIYQYDDRGRRGPLIAQIPSYINPNLLRQIATVTGAKAYMARDSGMLSRILEEIDRLERTKLRVIPKEKRWERFFIPALIITLILFLLIVLQETRFRPGAILWRTA